MFRLALSSLRSRKGSFAATFINVFLGAGILMAFSSLFDTGAAAGVSKQDKKTLTTMCFVVDGWGVLIVAFGIAATLNLVVRQRGTEIGLLKSAGAVPGQITRMIMGETAVVALLGAVLALPAGFFAGRAVVATLASTHQVTHGIAYHFGPMALSIGLGDTFLAAAVAAYITGRRAATVSTREALVAGAVETSKMSKKRIAFGIFFLLLGSDCGVLVSTALKHKGYLTMSLAGEACIHVSIGLALLSPLLLRLVRLLVGGLIRGFGGAPGYLADLNMRQRSNRMAGVLMPIILFVGMATGSLYMQVIENDAVSSGREVRTQDTKNVETLNFVIVATIAVFAAVVLINLAVTSTVYRRREFGQQRLVGSTPGQVRRMVRLESVITVITGLLAGTVAALASVVPFSIARADKVVPHIGPAIYLGVVATVIVLTFAANGGATRKALREPALDALAAGR
ncbi:putative ABC transport system permease protein [Catenulispora sp. GP43]|uniref:ABC transporter permease n=1 Tax=Catenulispora sp. GP43 TaxID=3156263 RepID=UPI00351239AF